MWVSDRMYSMCGAACIISKFFFPFSFFVHLPDSHPSYPPSMCVKREPHEASFAPFTPSSVGDSALADILPHQSSLSVDASTPSYLAHAHGPCYSQYASQPFIAGTTLPVKPRSQTKIQSASLWLTSVFIFNTKSKLRLNLICSLAIVYTGRLTVWPSLTATLSLPLSTLLFSTSDPFLVSRLNKSPPSPSSLVTGPKSEGRPKGGVVKAEM